MMNYIDPKDDSIWSESNINLTDTEGNRVIVLQRPLENKSVVFSEEDFKKMRPIRNVNIQVTEDELNMIKAMIPRLCSSMALIENTTNKYILSGVSINSLTAKGSLFGY